MPEAPNSSDHANKPHRPGQHGPKAKAKKERKMDPTSKGSKNINHKAFAIQSINKAAKNFRYAQDFKTKKHHVPIINRSQNDDSPPPVVVAVAGPPGSGKSTLIKCLIKHYCKQKITEINGPITVLCSKTKRITFIEVDNNINSMIDAAKVCDLALLLIDASYGFEMETFEFINICKEHGMPRVMGILTHMDERKQKREKSFSKFKHYLKKRFWADIYNGSKLFYLTKLIEIENKKESEKSKYKIHGEYQINEIKNLARFISIIKCRPIQFRQNHSYLLADRFEDITDPGLVKTDGKVDRKVVFYGYLRGCPMKVNSVHVAGVGDFESVDISLCGDPCEIAGKSADATARRKLDVRQQRLYAPFSGVGKMLFDRDAVYLDQEKVHEKNQTEEQKEQNAIIEEIQDMEVPLDEQMEEAEIQLVSGGRRLVGTAFGDDDMDNMDGIESGGEDDDENEDFGENGDFEEDGSEDDSADDGIGTEVSGKTSKSSQKAKGLDSDSDEEEDDAWRKDIADRAVERFTLRVNERKSSLQKLIYDVDEVKGENPSKFGKPKKISVGDSMFKTKIITEEIDSSSRKMFRGDSIADTDAPSWRPKDLQILFSSSTWTAEEGDAQSRLKQDDDNYGDFDDLETGESFGKNAKNQGLEGSNDKHVKNPDSDDSGDESDELGDEVEEISKRQRRMQKKLELRKMFDQEHDEKGNKIEKSWFDEEKDRLQVQMSKNTEHFKDLSPEERIKIQGFLPGQYVRIEIGKFPAEFSAFFNPKRPILIGSLTPNELNLNNSTSNYLNVRIKSHRWYKKILKNRDPLVISLGFRRFETCPVYYIEDHNLRKRMLKYTPEHMHCNAIIRAPLARQGEGFCAYQCTTDHTRVNFRIAATGVVLEADKSTQVVKKLKLKGEPSKIYKNTAIIKNMFASSLEVSKFIGAKIQTVSGIRGHIRKVERTPDGYFRATFEDKVRMSDLVFCKTWVNVKVPEHFRVVEDLLLKSDKQWFGMKTVGELRHERKIAVPGKKDSNYRKIDERPEIKKFSKVHVPNNLIAELPFKNKPKNIQQGKKAKTSHQKLLQAAVLGQFKSKEMKKGESLLTAAGLIMNEKKRKGKKDKEEYRKRKVKELEVEAKRKKFHEKEKKLGFR